MKHKPALETELKLRIPATGPYRPLLEALGFHEVTPAQAEISVLWDRDGQLRAAGSALRTRSYAGHARLTWKGPKVPDPILKIRPEHETGIADAAALEAILRALGFEPVMRMEKVRAVWEREELEACLDETPFGCYLELEGDPQAIRAAMEGLGLAPDRAEPRSYPELYRTHGLG
ncbi:class IV adenylate cyclase [Geothrix sp. PMB-07]|uniref:class IV adenylate cyclase n=1 Tax=Geothrix sp. PMB-07 TaxID=3068640 RepID=UPI002740B1CC|nr:class IV adenylate cyclase [Geothrix sp. PMB-07]WLT31959.1 class IV adenylate cyclase [Geothrix sp. PMB-07]